METTRMVMGLFVAVLLPRALPYVNRGRAASLSVSAGYGAYALAPVFGTWKFPLILLGALVWSYAVMRMSAAEHSPLGALEIVRLRCMRNRMMLGVAVVASLIACAAVIDVSALGYFFRHLLLDDRVAIVLTGLIAAVFVGHEPVTYISAVFMKSESKTDIFGMFIGWFERAFVFAFIASGQADAAALALAAKSIARYPKMGDDHEFARYFLVGTFSSVLIAILCAVITRVALGDRPM